MANTVIALKKSSTPASVPNNLANGELAINFADGKLFYKNTTGQIVSFSSGGNSFATVNANNTLIVAGSTSDILTIVPGSGIGIVGDAINDKITISTTGSSSTVTVSDTAPGSPTNGALWFNSTSGSMFIYYDDGTSSQWVEISSGTVLSGSGGGGGGGGGLTSSQVQGIAYQSSFLLMGA